MIHTYYSRTPRRTARAILLGALIAAGLGTASRADAAPSYTLATEVGTYQDLAGATQTSISPGDEPLQVLDLGEDAFNFFKKRYLLTGDQSLEVASAGFLRFWTDTSVVVLDGYFMNFSKRDETSTISYLIEGGPGEKILKVQWKNVGFPHGLATDYMNFQTWIYQKSGMIEFRMGPNQVEGADAYVEGGPWVGAFTSPKTFENMTEKCWITGDPAHPTFDTKQTLQFKRLTSTPAAGTIYRLTPNDVASVPESQDDARMLRLMPNPASDLVTFDLGTGRMADATLRITDMRGALLTERRLKEDERSIDVASLPAGIYVMEITSSTGRYVGRVTKQ